MNRFFRYFFSLFLVATFLGFATSCQSGASAEPEPQKALSMEVVEVQDTIQMDTIEKKYLLGQFEPEKDSQFVRMEDRHTGGSARGRYLHKETYEAFVQMHDSAKKDGITLTILSATRTFWYQKGIWERKWTGLTLVGGENLAKTIPEPAFRAHKILRYSSMPGTSRHHWGTDFDLNAFNNQYFSSGKGKKEFEWLEAKAAHFGFCRPYTAKGPHREDGYEEEKWHWSYMPLAQKYQKSYRAVVSISDIRGFEGSLTAAPLDVIEKYVFGIDPSCQ